jgi:hypothetical protein
MMISELLANATPVSVTKGKNLSTVGQHAGYLVTRFRGRPTNYIYGPDVADGTADKIAKNPYPDALFTRLKNKHAWQCKKVG